MPRSIQMLTDPMTAADRAAAKQEREAWAMLEKRIAELEAALRECMNYIYDEGAEPDGIRMAHVLQNTKP